VPTGSVIDGKTRVPTSSRIETTQLSLTEDEITELLSVVVKKGRPSYPAWKTSRRRKLNEMAEWVSEINSKSCHLSTIIFIS
jgi:hypothetical protein